MRRSPTSRVTSTRRDIDGLRFELDAENVCAGFVAWDLAGLVASARAFLDANALYARVWTAFEAQRRQTVSGARAGSRR